MGIKLLSKQNRRSFTEDVSSRIAVAVEESGRVCFAHQKRNGQRLWPFVALCLILLTYKIIEVLPGVTAGLIIKLITLVIIFVFFCLLKQNPFKIKQNLTLERI
jgi:hypothetical protein